MNLHASPYLARLCRHLVIKYLEYDRRERKSVRSISCEHKYEVLDWFEPSRGVITLRPVLMYYVIEIGSSLFLSGSFGGFPGIFRIVTEMSLGSLLFWLFPRISSIWIYHLYL
jgi:hypothetical protein